jgi:CLIP-associating protein 1/2
LFYYSPPELKRLTELLTKRFYDPNSQVFASFLDVLPEFIIAYKRELNDWLYALLTRLLIRMGAPDILDSTNKKLRQCLLIVNSSFDVHAQFTVLIRFINDNSAAPGIKVKEILLRYLQQTIQHMEPVDITNNADIRIALSKIINWSSEPKSIEMRKAAQAVIFVLHNLNRPEFNLMLTALPQSYQDAAAKIIRSASDTQSSGHSQLDNKYDFFQRSSLSGLTSPMTSSIHSDLQGPSYASDMRILMENMQALNVNHRQDDLLLSNSSSLKEKEHRSMIPVRHYTPSSYRSIQSQSHTTEPSDNILDTTDRPAAIDIALNMANTTTLPKEQRQHALRCISKFARLNDAETWDLAFSKTLNILTQILDNPNDDVIFKSYSLRIIRELLIHHTSLFLNYIELTIFRILKAQSETESEITRSAEQAAHAAAEHLPAESTIRVLKPIIEQAKYPMNQSAITMLQKTIELMTKETCIDLMPEMIPPLLTVNSNKSCLLFCFFFI